MSERKVLNKYYPPDFDPSKVPKCKEPRNKTFTIRLMAPCNMRCTTCGEYIYKGRKFNSRKEDVEDMDYLGLRIYRFYIKCTACVSEICFRTDPENTDYVLESGATRNFEALHKAQEQAEREDKAYKEELANNPMKLLEERTQASKNEMELVEALEELRELNKRTVAVDYNTMLNKYEMERKAAIEAEKAADEEFVNAVFSKEGGVKMKRIVEESSTSEDEKPRVKVAKTTTTSAPTDILTSGISEKPEAKKQVWEKSIGSLSSKKGLGVLVKKKTPTVFAKPKLPQDEKKEESKSDDKKGDDKKEESKSDDKKEECKRHVDDKEGDPGPSGAGETSGGNALGLLGAYSDTDTTASE